ncbi:hypothetical protein A3Q56_04443 [Intoshia linei]|uniref:Uncharacterized protein n=1 Tax=Intoshia linei TaxID=1819745 RepID=A0A177B2I8_9BILA|nr:hypothetical protein A3Q56_04443 [Intoshia linei]
MKIQLKSLITKNSESSGVNKEDKAGVVGLNSCFPVSDMLLVWVISGDFHRYAMKMDEYANEKIKLFDRSKSELYETFDKIFYLKSKKIENCVIATMQEEMMMKAKM